MNKRRLFTQKASFLKMCTPFSEERPVVARGSPPEDGVGDVKQYVENGWVFGSWCLADPLTQCLDNTQFQRAYLPWCILDGVPGSPQTEARTI
jgi:hypothetical protein